MKLTRWNPVSDLSSLSSDMFNMQREFNRLFDSFLRGGTQYDESMFTSNWIPSVDIVEKQDEYLVEIELPGVRKEDVKITLESNVLTIRGEKKHESEKKEDQYHRVERSYGAFQRSFTLPLTVKGDKIDASYKDGILQIHLPKAEEAKPKAIDVRVK